MSQRPRFAAALALCAPLLLAGCGEPVETELPGVGTAASATDGDLRVTVRTRRDELLAAQRLVLEIEAGAAAGRAIDLASVGLDSADWTEVRRVSHPPELVGPDRVGRRFELLLEPFLGGVYELPRVTVFAEGGDRPRAVASPDPASVRVLEVSAEDAALGDPAAIGGFDPPAAPPARWPIAVGLSVGAAAAVGACCTGAVLVVRRRRAAAASVPGIARRVHAARVAAGGDEREAVVAAYQAVRPRLDAERRTEADAAQARIDLNRYGGSALGEGDIAADLSADIATLRHVCGLMPAGVKR